MYTDGNPEFQRPEIQVNVKNSGFYLNGVQSVIEVFPHWTAGANFSITLLYNSIIRFFKKLNMKDLLNL